MTTQELIEELKAERDHSFPVYINLEKLEQIIKALEESELIKEDMLIAYRYGVEKGKEE